MSGNNYGYYYTQNATNYPDKPWSEWSIEQQQYNSNYRNNPLYEGNSSNSNIHSGTHPPPLRTAYYNYHGNAPQINGRPYHQRRYNAGNSQYVGGQVVGAAWNRNPGYKRARLDSDDPSETSKAKSSKKKKKPLSQNMPSKKDWTIEEAEMALNCEREYNKRHKNQSLIIKFPDLELNKEIVSKFHGSIENVHFQQPSTARFCFVTLEESADADTVINALNKVKFGDGYLTAEYKKDREDDQNIGPEDIDPNTLYVGNLAQEITKEDMIKTYPKCKRIDIGYAKKMKYTRYAFVTFKTVTDSVEAFKKTHSTQMYSKSLIVRFRRLHGTVGMPGESKPQNPPKPKEPTASDSTSTDKEKDSNIVDLNLVKQEPESWEEEEHKNLDDDLEEEFEMHRPKIKTEIKDEPRESLEMVRKRNRLERVDVKNESDVTAGSVKTEPNDDDFDGPNSNTQDNESSEDEMEDDLDNDNFSSLYASMISHAHNINSLKKSSQ